MLSITRSLLPLLVSCHSILSSLMFSVLSPLMLQLCHHGDRSAVLRHTLLTVGQYAGDHADVGRSLQEISRGREEAFLALRQGEATGNRAQLVVVQADAVSALPLFTMS